MQTSLMNADQSYHYRYSGDYSDKDYSNIKVINYDSNNITTIAIDLWYAANEVYNVDDNQLFDMGDWISLFPEEPEYIEEF